MAVKLRDTSRLRFARLITVDDVECWELPEYPVILPASDDLQYVVSGNEVIDQIAKRFYNSEELWWIIALANGFEILPVDLTANQSIIIPSALRVFNDILKRPSRGREGRR